MSLLFALMLLVLPLVCVIYDLVADPLTPALAKLGTRQPPGPI